jgi:hypothetical protein
MTIPVEFLCVLGNVSGILGVDGGGINSFACSSAIDCVSGANSFLPTARDMDEEEA